MESLAGARTFVRLILRRDRVRLTIWIAGVAGLCFLLASSLPGLFPTAADRQAAAELMDNPIAAAFAGPTHGQDNYTLGAMLANELLSIAAVIVALMSIFLVIRHTRTEEETGRSELVRAAVVGRHAATVATLAVVSGAHLVIALLFAVTVPALNEEYTIAGSIAFGVSLASVGLVFAAIALVAAQVTEHARGAIGYGVAVLGVAYVLRAAGDMGLGPLAWLSPIGWAQATRSYVDERWWPLLLSLALGIVLVAVAAMLSTRRDVGGGLVATRPGPPGASRLLGHPLGMALRLLRGLLIAWGIGLLLLGLTYGALVSEVEAFSEDNPAMEDFFVQTGGAAFDEAYVAMILLLNAMLAAVFALQGTLRMRGEETAGRAEPLLATALTRWGWSLSYLVIVIAGSALILVLSGAGMGLTAALVTGDGSWILRVAGAALAYLPGLWLMVGLAIALFGLAPRWTALAWLVLLYGLIEWLLGGLLGLPEWTADLSPFRHVPQLPAEDFSAVPVVVLTALAAALLVAGLVGLRRRDIAAV